MSVIQCDNEREDAGEQKQRVKVKGQRNRSENEVKEETNERTSFEVANWTRKFQRAPHSNLQASQKGKI